MLPVYYTIFNQPPPWLSDKEKLDISQIGNWFGEENFTYIRVFGSIFDPHVLPLYVPDKLLAQEISYQLTEKGMSRCLKNSKKLMWPTFSFNCGTYTLNDFKHAEKEVLKIRDLKLAIVPGRQYDPDKVAFDFTTLVQIAKFEHEADDFDYLFVSIEKFSQVYDLAKSKFQAEDMNKFM